jgi:hypothetical protein
MADTKQWRRSKTIPLRASRYAGKSIFVSLRLRVSMVDSSLNVLSLCGRTIPTPRT